MEGRRYEYGYVPAWKCIAARIRVRTSPLLVQTQLTSFSFLRHWDWFLGSIHGGAVIDQPGGYGWEGARALNKDLAKYNADSYGWYATETFWAILCGAPTGYNAPGVEKRTE